MPESMGKIQNSVILLKFFSRRDVAWWRIARYFDVAFKRNVFNFLKNTFVLRLGEIASSLHSSQ
jgi:hypothetical protein